VRLDTLWTPELEGGDGEAYDRFVLESPGGHFAQTRAWTDVARRSRPCGVRYFIAREAGRVVGTALVLCARLGPLPLPFAHVERGPVCADPASAARVVDALASAARRRGIARISVMPYWADEHALRVHGALGAAGFRDVQAKGGTHARTLRLELGKGDAVFAGGERAHLRHLRREAERAGVTVRRGDRVDLETHRRLYGAMFLAENRRHRSSAWYDALHTSMLDGTRGALFVGEQEGQAVATAIALRHGPLAVYAYGATRGARARFSKSVLPLVAAVHWAKDLGCTTFDLGGIPLEEDRDPKRAAIARFKLCFSKTPVPLVREHARWF
jgi:hypothetical protein